uniref:Uncharacterized protein n=1 Tax=Zooxanthella nutricula TaxID=1333877 RepID=A0A7S2L0H4_9DINO
MNKCILVVIQITCAPTQHLKTLNPHLDHAAFDAFYSNEHCPYMYNAGHCQVSSFGVGGTNGHAIFWGEARKPIVDVKQKLLVKVMNSAPPIIADGPDPADWEYSGPPFDLKDGEKCSITYWKDPVTGDEEVRFDRQLKAIAAPAEFYCTSGNHNDWTDDRMVEGDRPGLFFQEVEIPDSGRLEFRILADGEHDRSIGPEETTESRSVPIIGPGSDVRTSWIATGRPGDLMRIEYMTTQGPSGGAGLQSVSWFPVEA